MEVNRLWSLAYILLLLFTYGKQRTLTLFDELLITSRVGGGCFSWFLVILYLYLKKKLCSENLRQQTRIWAIDESNRSRNLGNSGIKYFSSQRRRSQDKSHTQGRLYSATTTSGCCKTDSTIETIQNLKIKLRDTMGVERGYKPKLHKSRSNLLSFLPASQGELPSRTMRDSFTTALIPLSTDVDLQDKYISFLEQVRIGRLLEDMDIFAVVVAMNHIENPKQPEDQPSPYTIVTALVDQIDFTDYIPKPNEDIQLSGHVSWVGSSSIEVIVWLKQKHQGIWMNITKALFLMVARDPTATKAAIINPLEATNEQEEEIIANGEERKKRRKMIQRQHLTKGLPNAEEQELIHALFLRTMSTDEISLNKRILPTGCVWMEACTLSNLIFSQPEDRNLHNKVFGGFLMRQALELSWALGYLFSKYRPKLKSISDINFQRPVEVNSLIRMQAHVVFTYRQHFQILLYADTWDPHSGKNTTTNTFHFTYEVPGEVPEVFPRTYHEAMMYIDGQRHFNDVMDDKEDIFTDPLHE